MSNKELRISKYGIARAAQALAPRVALSFYMTKNDRIPYFDIHHSVIDIRYSIIFLMEQPEWSSLSENKYF
jgi:hypothetical protein